MKDLLGRLASKLNLRRHQVERTVALFDEGSTVPFVARYRKEITGGLDEETLADFREQLNALRKLDARQKTVIKTIEEQGKLTPAERKVMEQHCNIGAQILQQEPEGMESFLKWYEDQSALQCIDNPILEMASTIALSHHEKWDGSGYPHGLAGEDRWAGAGMKGHRA